MASDDPLVCIIPFCVCRRSPHACISYVFAYQLQTLQFMIKAQVQFVGNFCLILRQAGLASGYFTVDIFAAPVRPGRSEVFTVNP